MKTVSINGTVQNVRIVIGETTTTIELSTSAGVVGAPVMDEVAQPLEAVVVEPSKRRGRPAKGKGLHRFDEWYSLYPRKVNRGHAEKAWSKVATSDELINTMIAALKLQRENPEWRKENGAFCPHPATWLNGKRWMDEVVGEQASALPFAHKPWAAFIRKGTLPEVLNLMAAVGMDDADAVQDELENQSLEEVCDWLWSFKEVKC